ncbi:MAG: hypothetical protein M1522_07725, partial [Actinobacteria bacterium]|nr:hypothetical protein [Actinomycetota bacterium]
RGEVVDPGPSGVPELPCTGWGARHEWAGVRVLHEDPLGHYYWWSRKAPSFRLTGRVRLRGVTPGFPGLPSTMLHDSCRVPPASAPRFALALTVVC